MHFLGLRRRRGAPGPNRPDRFVGDDGRGEGVDSRGRKHCIQLAEDHRTGRFAFPFRKRFADAQDRRQRMTGGRDEFPRHQFVL